MNDGALLYSIETCRDTHDVFVDNKRKRICFSCG
jgi:hypothetical protein